MKLSSHVKIILSGCALFMLLVSIACPPSKSKNEKRKEARLHYEIAKSHFSRGDHLAALKELLKSVDLDENNPESQYLLGTTYYILERYPEAEKHLINAITLKEDYPDANNNLGNVYIAMGRWDDAIVNFEKCLEYILYQPNFPTVYTNIGIAHMKKGDMKQAELAFRTAIKLNEKFCPAHLNMGDLYSKQKRPQEAIMEYEKVLKFCPDTQFALLAHLYMGTELNTMGRREEACGHFFIVSKKTPDTELGLKAEQYIRLLKCR